MPRPRRLSDAVTAENVESIAASLRKYGYRGPERPAEVARLAGGAGRGHQHPGRLGEDLRARAKTEAGRVSAGVASRLRRALRHHRMRRGAGPGGGARGRLANRERCRGGHPAAGGPAPAVRRRTARDRPRLHGDRSAAVVPGVGRCAFAVAEESASVASVIGCGWWISRVYGLVSWVKSMSYRQVGVVPLGFEGRRKREELRRGAVQRCGALGV